MKRTAWGLALTAIAAFAAVPAQAATTYTVSGTPDESPGTGSCTTANVCTSLRAAVANVPAGSTIQLGSGIYKLTGFLAVKRDVSIVGVSPAQTTIQQTKPGDGVIEADTGTALSLVRLTVTGGREHGAPNSDPHAGGIFTQGTSLTLDHVSVTQNTATGASAAGVSGGDAVGGIQIDGASTALTITNSSITNNTATGGTGASITNGNGKPGGTAYGALSDFALAPTITNSVISGNTAIGGNGGTGSGNSGFTGGTTGQANGAVTIIAHPASSTTLITASTIANNATIGGRAGSGLSSAHGGSGNTGFGALTGGGNTIKVVSSTISGNTAQSAVGATGTPDGSPGTVLGGGIGVEVGNLVVINSTITANIVSGTDGEGGGISMSGGGTLTLGSDTIFGNTAPRGGNLSVSGTALRIGSTIIAGGVQPGGGANPPSANCSLDTVIATDVGDNLESTSPPQCGLDFGMGDLVGIGPQLASLASNGGPTATMAVGVRSPALGAGGACLDLSQPGTVALTTDQRGLPRATPCDIGAFQHQPVTEQTTPAIAGTPAFGATLTCTPGSWTGDGVAVTDQWFRGSVPISGATSGTHVVVPADFGREIGCAVTATGTYGRGVVTVRLTMPASCNCTPKVTRLGQSNRRWRRGTRLATLTAAARVRGRARARRIPVGTAFTFTLDRAARVTLSFTASRTTPAGQITFNGHAGRNRIAFAGRLTRSRRLATGNYLLGVTAALPGGPASRSSTLRFRIVG